MSADNAVLSTMSSPAPASTTYCGPSGLAISGPSTTQMTSSPPRASTEPVVPNGATITSLPGVPVMAVLAVPAMVTGRPRQVAAAAAAGAPAPMVPLPARPIETAVSRTAPSRAPPRIL